MAPRANWKGTLSLGELTCAIALYSAATTSERVSFHTINRKTGNRVKRIFVDSDSQKPVEPADQVKGYRTEADDYVVLEPDEIAAVIPESDKSLAIKEFIACSDIDTIYFDKPYYLAPADKGASELYGLIAAAMSERKVAALAHAVLFRRVRTVLIRAHDKGLLAHTLHFDYEVRSAEEAFEDIPAIKVNADMAELAQHIIKTKLGAFDPATFDDRYDAALAALVKAKTEGKPLPKRSAAAEPKVIDLMEALRASAEAAKPKAQPKAKAKTKTKAKARAPAKGRKAA